MVAVIKIVFMMDQTFLIALVTMATLLTEVSALPSIIAPLAMEIAVNCVCMMDQGYLTAIARLGTKLMALFVI